MSHIIQQYPVEKASDISWTVNGKTFVPSKLVFSCAEDLNFEGGKGNDILLSSANKKYETTKLVYSSAKAGSRGFKPLGRVVIRHVLDSSNPEMLWNTKNECRMEDNPLGPNLYGFHSRIKWPTGWKEDHFQKYLYDGEIEGKTYMENRSLFYLLFISSEESTLDDEVEVLVGEENKK
jgi:hypothetical protein